MKSIFIALLALVILTSINQPVKRQQTAPARVKPALVQKPNTQPTAKIEPLTAPIQQPTCEAEIIKYDWQHETATAIARAESGLNPNALNDNPATGDYSVGCFQVNIYGANARSRPSEAELKDPQTNVAWAYKLYTGNHNSFIGQWGVCRAKVNCY